MLKVAAIKKSGVDKRAWGGAIRSRGVSLRLDFQLGFVRRHCVLPGIFTAHKRVQKVMMYRVSSGLLVSREKIKIKGISRVSG